MSPTLALMLLMAAPKAPPGSELVISVPRLDALATIVPFFHAAGSRAPMLRVEYWRSEAIPLLAVDVTSPDSLAAAGIEPTGALTVSKLADRTVSCVTVADATRYARRVAEALAPLGKVSTRKEAGVPITLARDPIDRVLAAVATQGRQSCSIVGGGLSVEPQLPALVKALTKPLSLAPTGGLDGAAFAFVPVGSPRGVVALSARGLQLTLDARAQGLFSAALQGPGPSPYASFAPEGMMVLRARFTSAGMPGAVGELVRRLPASPALTPLIPELAPLLTGNVAVAVSHVKVTTGLRSSTARFFATRHAVLAETSNPEAVRQLLAKLDPSALTFREGRLDVSVEGTTVILSNDDEVKRRAMAAAAQSQGRQAHAAEVSATPALVARGLSQVPLLEAVQSPALATLLAVSAELGGLLLASKSITGWADPAGPGLHRAQATWRLDDGRFATDGGAQP